MEHWIPSERTVWGQFSWLKVMTANTHVPHPLTSRSELKDAGHCLLSEELWERRTGAGNKWMLPITLYF